MSRTAPLGIKLLAVLLALEFLPPLLVLIGAVASRYGPSGFLLFLLGLVPASAALVVPYGLWTLKPWAYKLTMAYLLFVLLFWLAAPGFTNVGYAVAVVSLAVASLLAGYLYTRRGHFDTSRPAPG